MTVTTIGMPASDLTVFLTEFNAWRDAHFQQATTEATKAETPIVAKGGTAKAEPNRTVKALAGKVPSVTNTTPPTLAAAGHLLREAVELVFAVKRLEVGGRALSFSELMETLTYVEEQVAVASDREGVGKVPAELTPKQLKTRALVGARLEVADVALMAGLLAHLLKFDLLEAMREKAAVVQARTHGPADASGVIEHLRDNANAELRKITARLEAE